MACGGCGGKILDGAKGLAKAAFRIDRADPQHVQERNALCQACPEARKCSKNATRKCFCGVCDCFLPAKLRIKSEKCPLDKWGAVE
jgi:hypothetical protein